MTLRTISNVIVLSFVAVACLVSTGCVSKGDFELKTTELAQSAAANEDKIASLTSKLATAETQLITVNKKLAALEKLLPLDTRVAKIEKSLAGYDKLVGEMSNEVASLTTRVKNLDKAVAQAASEESITKLSKSVDTRIAALGEKDVALDKEDTKLDERVARIDGTLDTAAADLATTRTLVSKLTEEMEKLGAMVTASLAGQDVQITGTRQTIVGILRGEYTALEARMRQLNGAINSLDQNTSKPKSGTQPATE